MLTFLPSINEKSSILILVILNKSDVITREKNEALVEKHDRLVQVTIQNQIESCILKIHSDTYREYVRFLSE